MTQIADVSVTSDKDYLKIFADGELFITAAGTPDADSTFPADPQAPFGFTGVVNIPHPLQIVPLIRAFYDPLKNGLWYSSRIDFGDPWLKIIATTTNLKLIVNTDGAAKTDIPVFYRIYDLGLTAVDSDARIDKIFKTDSSSGTANPGASSMDPAFTTITIPHPAGEAPIWTLQFSENGADWYPEGTQIVGPPDTGSGPPGGPYSRFYYTSAYGAADANNFYVVLENNYSSGRNIYYRYALDYRK